MSTTPITDRIEALRLAEQTADDLAALLQKVADVNAELRRGLIERASEAARLRQQVWDLECQLDRAHGTIRAMREHPSMQRVVPS